MNQGIPKITKVQTWTSNSNVDALGNDDLEYISDDPELGLEDRHLQDLF